MIYSAEHALTPATRIIPSGSRRGGPTVTLVCDCECGSIFERSRSAVKPNARHYLSNEHLGAHKSRVYLEEMCGPFLSIVKEYLDHCSLKGYKSTSKNRIVVSTFALFLTERGISDLEQVSSKTITQFLSWAEDVEYDNASRDLSVLVGFLKWAICSGYRKSSCPIILKFHGKKRPEHLPRPYSREQMDLIWELAKGRGNRRIRAIVAIGEESGLRIGEICRLRVEDIDIQGQRLFVRLPNKGDCERWAPFRDKTAQYIAEWLLEREEDCGHDHLFHNTLGDKLLPQAAHREMCRTFCKLYGGQIRHEDGLDQWSTHRLRHTMASNLRSGGASLPVIMKVGGAVSFARDRTCKPNRATGQTAPAAGVRGWGPSARPTRARFHPDRPCSPRRSAGLSGIAPLYRLP